MEACEKFVNHIRTGNPVDVSILDRIVERYPWFVTARVMRDMAAGSRDQLLELHYHSHPFPSRTGVDLSEFDRPDSLSIIDKFLDGGEHRIVPSQEEEHGFVAGGEEIELPDEMLTEELAQIYLAQGLKAEAKEIYAKLSLLYPEKSVYFAEIIGKIDC